MARTNLKPALTVGQLRALLATLPDRTSIGILPDEEDSRLDRLRTVFVELHPSGTAILRASQHAARLLFEAVPRNDCALARGLVADGVDVDVPDPRNPLFDGARALTVAAELGLIEMTRTLIELGADVNARSGSGWTALMRACNAGHLETARVLLDSGADATLANDEGYTAYGRISASDAPLLRLFEERGADTRGRP
jgi:hypothetical protein